MSKDLTVALRVQAIAEGLQNIHKLVAELDAVGVSTAGYKKEAAELNAELKHLGQEQSLIEAFRKSKVELRDTGRTLAEAKEKAADLARALNAAGKPTNALTQQFERAKKRVVELAAAEQQQRLKLQDLRQTMDKAGLSTKGLADQQRRAKQEMEAATGRASQLEQTLEKAKARLAEAGAAGSQAGQAIQKGMQGGAEGAGTLKASIASAKAQLLALLSVAGAMRLAENLAENADAWKQYQAQLKLATDSTDEQARAEEALFKISQDTRSDLEASISLYARLARGRKELGLQQQQLLDLTKLVAQAFKVSGAAQSESAAGTLQLSQALASGVLRGDEFNSVMENGIRIAQALADGLGVPIGQLRAMAEAGELTAQRVTAALLSQKDAIEDEYAQLPLTIEGSLTRISNAWQRYIGEADEAAGASTRVAEGLAKIAEHFDEIADLAIAAGEILIAVFAVKGVNALRAFASEALLAKASVSALNLELGAAAAKLGGLRVAGNLALSAFTGWEIGSYLREQFVEVEQAGIAMTSGLTKAAEGLRYLYESAEALVTDDTLEQATARHEERLRKIDDTYFQMWQDAGKAAQETNKAASGIEQTGVAAAGAAPMLGGLKNQVGAVATEAASLSKALKTLGVDVEELKTGIAASDRSLIESFQQVATSADASSQVIVAAYGKAVESAKGVQTIRALNDSLIQSFEKGKISAHDYAVALDEGIKKLQDLPGAAQAAQEATSEFQKALAGAKFTSDLHAMAQEVQEAWKHQEISADEYKEKIAEINTAMRKLENDAAASLAGIRQETEYTAQAAGGFSEAFGQAGVAGVETMDDVRRAIGAIANSEEVASLKSTLQHLFDEGIISAQEFEDAIGQVDDKLADVEIASSTASGAAGSRSVSVSNEQLIEARKQTLNPHTTAIDAQTRAVQRETIELASKLLKEKNAEEQAAAERDASAQDTASTSQTGTGISGQSVAPSQIVRVELNVNFGSESRTVPMDVPASQAHDLLAAVNAARLASA